MTGQTAAGAMLACMLIALPANATEWRRSVTTDEMTGARRTTFSIQSSNVASFGFPYGGPHHATLYAKGGDWMVHVPAQILHSQGARLSVDGAAPVAVDLGESTDADPKVAFFSSAGIKNARTIKLEMTFYQEGTRVFTFNATTPLAGLAAYATAQQAQQPQAKSGSVAKLQETLGSACKEGNALKGNLFESAALIVRDDVNAGKLDGAAVRHALQPYEACLTKNRAYLHAAELLKSLTP